MNADTELAKLFIDNTVRYFREEKDLADRAIRQVKDDNKLHEPLDDNTNSIAIIMKHMAGNMRSRWTKFLIEDGEKEWRARDDEFVDDLAPRDELLRMWEDGWNCLIDALSSLTADDLCKSVFINKVQFSVVQAIQKQLSHYSYHVGQIVQLARFHAKDNWIVLTVPKGQSTQYNKRISQSSDEAKHGGNTQGSGNRL